MILCTMVLYSTYSNYILPAPRLLPARCATHRMYDTGVFDRLPQATYNGRSKCAGVHEASVFISLLSHPPCILL